MCVVVVLLGQTLELVVVDRLRLEVQAVGHEVVELAREVDRAPVGKMAALIQAHAEHLVAGLDERGVGGQVSVGAAVGLDVGELGIEELTSAIASEVLHDIDLLAASVIALTRIALGVFVGQHAAHGLKNGRAHDVLGRDELDRSPLTRELLIERAGDRRVLGR